MAYKFKIGDKEYEARDAEHAVSVLTKTLEKSGGGGGNAGTPKTEAQPQSWEDYVRGASPTQPTTPPSAPTAPPSPTRIFRDPTMFMRGLMNDPETAFKEALKEIVGEDLKESLTALKQLTFAAAQEGRQSRFENVLDSNPHLDAAKAGEVLSQIVMKDHKGIFTARNMKKALETAFNKGFLPKPEAKPEAPEPKTSKTEQSPKPKVVEFDLPPDLELMELEDDDLSPGEMTDEKLLKLAETGDLDKVGALLDSLGSANDNNLDLGMEQII